MLKYWEALKDAMRPEFRSPPHCKDPLRDLHQNLLQEVTGIITGAVVIQGMSTKNSLPPPRLTTVTRILVMPKLSKIQRRRVGTASGRGSATPESSTKRTSVRSANKHQNQLSTSAEIPTKSTSVRYNNKYKSHI